MCVNLNGDRRFAPEPIRRGCRLVVPCTRECWKTEIGTDKGGAGEGCQRPKLLIALLLGIPAGLIFEDDPLGIRKFSGTRRPDAHTQERERYEKAFHAFFPFGVSSIGKLAKDSIIHPMIPIFKVKSDVRGMCGFLISSQRSHQQFSHQTRIKPRTDKKASLKPRLVLGEMFKYFDGTLIGIRLQNPVYDFFQRARLSFRP